MLVFSWLENIVPSRPHCITNIPLDKLPFREPLDMSCPFFSSEFGPPLAEAQLEGKQWVPFVVENSIGQFFSDGLGIRPYCDRPIIFETTSAQISIYCTLIVS
jgi:hypothetical protein